MPEVRFTGGNAGETFMQLITSISSTPHPSSGRCTAQGQLPAIISTESFSPLATQISANVSSKYWEFFSFEFVFEWELGLWELCWLWLVFPQISRFPHSPRIYTDESPQRYEDRNSCCPLSIWGDSLDARVDKRRNLVLNVMADLQRCWFSHKCYFVNTYWSATCRLLHFSPVALNLPYSKIHSFLQYVLPNFEGFEGHCELFDVAVASCNFSMVLKLDEKDKQFHLICKTEKKDIQQQQ